MTGEVVALLGFDDRHQDVIRNTNHTHQGKWCLESLFCRGPAERVRRLTYQLQDFDGVRRVKIMIFRDGDGG